MLHELVTYAKGAPMGTDRTAAVSLPWHMRVANGPLTSGVLWSRSPQLGTEKWPLDVGWVDGWRKIS